MEKENIEKIMEEYKSGLLQIEGKDNDIEINKMNLHIQKLKDEREEVKSEKSLYEEYTKRIKEAENELKNYKNKDTQTEINKINYRIKKIEDQKSELNIREYNKQMEDAKKELESLNAVETPEYKKQKEIEKMNLKDNAIKDLTQANIKIGKAIDEAQLEHINIMNEIGKFELKYDENHMALNGNERRELFDKSHKIIDKINELREAKTKCEEYLVELKQPSKEVEAINSILNKTYNSNLREATERDLEVKDEKNSVETKSDEKENINLEKVENIETKKIDLDDIDFNLPKEESEEKTIETKKEKNVKEIDENKQEEVKTIYINGKKSEIYINQDKKNPIKIDYSENKDLVINEIINDTFNVVPKEIKKLEDSLKNPNISKENRIANEQLLKTYKDQQEQLNVNGKQVEFQYADPNIVVALKNNPEKLQEYADFLNGKKKIDKEQKMSFNIKYDIRGLSKSEMSDEEKQQIEDYAFIHRNIAKIKKTPIQAIKFAFKGLLEKFRKVKALPAASLIYTMSDEGKKSYYKAYEQSKSFKESLKVEEKEEKANTNIDEKMNRYEELAKKINDSFDKDDIEK